MNDVPLVDLSPTFRLALMALVIATLPLSWVWLRQRGLDKMQGWDLTEEACEGAIRFRPAGAPGSGGAGWKRVPLHAPTRAMLLKRMEKLDAFLSSKGLERTAEVLRVRGLAASGSTRGPPGCKGCGAADKWKLRTDTFTAFKLLCDGCGKEFDAKCGKWMRSDCDCRQQIPAGRTEAHFLCEHCLGSRQAPHSHLALTAELERSYALYELPF